MTFQPRLKGKSHDIRESLRQWIMNLGTDHICQAMCLVQDQVFVTFFLSLLLDEKKRRQEEPLDLHQYFLIELQKRYEKVKGEVVPHSSAKAVEKIRGNAMSLVHDDEWGTVTDTDEHSSDGGNHDGRASFDSFDEVWLRARSREGQAESYCPPISEFQIMCERWRENMRVAFASPTDKHPTCIFCTPH